MKYRALFFPVVCLCFLFLFACSVPKYPVADPCNRVQMDPEIVYGVLPNGFQYILKNNTIPEKRVSLHLNVFAGSVNETEEQQGGAHYLEHMLFNGSEHYKPGELIAYFQSIGMDFGADANASTTFHHTVYDLSLPENDQAHLDDALVIIQDYAGGATLLESEIDRERGIIQAEKRERDSVSYRTFKKSFEFELPGSRLNQRFPIGIDRVIATLDQDQLKAFYDQWYRPDNMALVIVGDVDVRMVEQMIIQRFSRLKPRTRFAPAPATVKWQEHQGNKAFYHFEPEASSTDVTIETIAWTEFKQDTPEAICTRTLKRVANSMLQNRLSIRVNRQTADFSDASVFSGTFLHHLTLSSISATCEPGKWKKGLVQIEKALRQALDHGFTQTELERVKADFISSLERQVDQDGSQKSSDLARKILGTINRKGLLLSAQQEKDLLVPYIEQISLQDAHDALKQDWSKDHRLVLVTGNARIDSPDPEGAIQAVFENSFSEPVEPYTTLESKPFPYLELPRSKAHIQSRQDNVKNLGITTVDLDNGIRLNLKKTDFKKNQFLFKVCFGNGKKSQPVSSPGLAIFSERVLKAGGLGRLDTDELETALAGKKVSMEFSVHDDYFSFSGASDPGEAELVFQLIYHYLNDPGYKTDALHLAKIRYRQWYNRLARTPDGIMQIKGDSFLAENDTRFGLPVPDIIDAYTLDHIKNWVMPSFQTAPIEISIAGDFDLEPMIDLASTYMGAFSPRKRLLKDGIARKKIGFPAGQNLELNLDTVINTGVVHVAFLTDDFMDIMQTRRLSVLSRVFSERLRLVIREELAQTYSPYVYNDPSTSYEGYGVLHVVVNVKPGNETFVYEKIKAILDDLTLNGISAAETQTALNPVLNQIKVFRQTNAYWLNSVMVNSSRYPEKFDWADQMISGFESIVGEDLTLLAKKYLKIDRGALIIIKPERLAE